MNQRNAAAPEGFDYLRCLRKSPAILCFKTWFDREIGLTGRGHFVLNPHPKALI
jgi:hypothetical protein